MAAQQSLRAQMAARERTGCLGNPRHVVRKGVPCFRLMVPEQNRLTRFVVEVDDELLDTAGPKLRVVSTMSVGYGW